MQMENQQMYKLGSHSKEQSLFEDYLMSVYMQESEKVPPIPEKLFNENREVKNSKLCIKNMVSIRCIIAVKAVLTKLEIPFSSVELANVSISVSLTEQKRKKLKSALEMLGFELVEDKKSVLVEEIKNAIVEMIQYDEVLPKTKFSEYLSKQLNHNYIYLSNIFSKVKGITIGHFILSHKIERVKQLLLYNELTLSEIAWKLQYSSVAHLSNQFKKITGITPTHFKNMKGKGLISHENL